MINCNVYVILVCRGRYHTKIVLSEITCPSKLLGRNISVVYQMTWCTTF